MKKEELIAMLSEGLTIEEIPTISNLEEIKELVAKSNLSPDIKKRLDKNIAILLRDTITHSKAFSKLIKDHAK